MVFHILSSQMPGLLWHNRLLPNNFQLVTHQTYEHSTPHNIDTQRRKVNEKQFLRILLPEGWSYRVGAPIPSSDGVFATVYVNVISCYRCHSDENKFRSTA
jgi:hypothetical protein